MNEKDVLQCRIDRVAQMEQYMDEVFVDLQTSPKKIKENEELRRKISVLTDYMDSGQWLADYEADERGELPRGLKRGVLSEDGLYNLLEDVRAIQLSAEEKECNYSEKEDKIAAFSLNEMQEMQKSLQDRYKTIWEPIGPKTGKNKLLWMIGEIGEVIDIVKKNGDTKACSDANLRRDLVEELADVLMYYNDVLLCYGITPEELKQAYTEKFKRNMTRWGI